jgi:hypothetical protein
MMAVVEGSVLRCWWGGRVRDEDVLLIAGALGVSDRNAGCDKEREAQGTLGTMQERRFQSKDMYAELWRISKEVK